MSSLTAPVSTVMSQPTAEVDGTTPVKVAAEKLLDGEIGSVIITTPKRGILTKTDLVAGITAGTIDPNQPVTELMTTDPITVTETTTIEEAVKTMDSNGVKRLPVVDETDTIVGIITSSDLLGALASETDAPIGTLATAISELDTTAPHRYECLECSHQVTAETRPSGCPECEAEMRNITVPRE